MTKLFCKNGQPSKQGVKLYLSYLLKDLRSWINPIARYYPEAGELVAKLYNLLRSYSIII